MSEPLWYAKPFFPALPTYISKPSHISQRKHRKLEHLSSINLDTVETTFLKEEVDEYRLTKDPTKAKMIPAYTNIADNPKRNPWKLSDVQGLCDIRFT